MFSIKKSSLNVLFALLFLCTVSAQANFVDTFLTNNKSFFKEGGAVVIGCSLGFNVCHTLLLKLMDEKRAKTIRLVNFVAGIAGSYAAHTFCTKYFEKKAEEAAVEAE